MCIMKKCLFLLCILMLACSRGEVNTGTDTGSDTEVVLSFKRSMVEMSIAFSEEDEEDIINTDVEVGLTSIKDRATVQIEVDKELSYNDGDASLLPDECYSIASDVRITSKNYTDVPIKFIVNELKKLDSGDNFYIPLRVTSSDKNIVQNEEKCTCMVLLTIDKSGWTLVWSDEFDYVGAPDPTKWVPEKGFVRNKELQYYTSDNAYVNGECLVITGKQERKENPNYNPNATGNNSWKYTRKYAEYTSSSLCTFGAATDWRSWLYGRFEIRAKLPKAVKTSTAANDEFPRGPFPAIWTVGQQGWPKSGEIDLLEYAFRPENLGDGPCLHTNMVYLNPSNGSDKWKSKSRRITYFRDGTVGMTPNDKWPAPDPEWMNKFHIWRLDWTYDYIKVYIDDILFFECNLNEMPANEVGAFRNFRHALLLNLAIGNKGGEPVNVEFPIEYCIDYVRIYKLINEK